MGKYFGTDGIRGKVEKFTPEFVGKVAKGLIDYAGNDGKKILIGGDTRESSEWIARDFEKAFLSLGVDCGNVGVLPTPGINYAFYDMEFDLAIDITASHNPYTDNGIKVFERGERGGVKLSPAGVEKIENALDDINTVDFSGGELNENLHEDALERYVLHLLDYTEKFDRPEETDRMAVSLAGLKIGLDCANGATSVVAERVFKELGAEVTVINNDANYGQKINREAGSTHLEHIQMLVRERGLDFGMAFDGDGDRCLMVDNSGEIVDGDKIMAVVANFLGLKKVAATVMANQGLFEWAKQNGVEIAVTDVGDQHVARAMKEQGILLGGENSGHIILPGEAMGDGVLTGLIMSKIVKKSGKTLAEVASVMKSFPQIVENFEASPEAKERFKAGAGQEILDAYSTRLENSGGRLLVRPSGTEDLIRITLWGDDLGEITEMAKALAEELKSALNKEENGRS